MSIYLEKILSVPSVSRAHDLPGAGWVLYQLSYGGTRGERVGSYSFQPVFTPLITFKFIAIKIIGPCSIAGQCHT